MYKNKLALITGSTSGIGLGIAEEMAKNGYNIALNGFGKDDEIKGIINNLETYNVKVYYYPTDISSEEQVKSMVQEISNKGHQVDILVNNAGIQHVSPIEDFAFEDWNKVISINLSAAFLTIKNVLPGMKKNGWGRIINIASAHGKVASINKAAYVAAKHGIVGLTKVVALETAELNITCNSICPGWVLTPLVQKQIDAIAEKDNISIEKANYKLLSEKQPSLKFVMPNDIGSFVVFLCTDAANQITGSDLSIDGGWTAR